MIQLDKEKYLRILQEEGLSAAITSLHLDKETWEHKSFDGDRDQQRQMLGSLEKVRELSRELWDIALTHPEKIKK